MFTIETIRWIIKKFTLDMAYDVHINSLDIDDRRFNNESLKDAKVYEIEAVVNDGYSETTHKYKGFKMTELLKLLESFVIRHTYLNIIMETQ